jgi:hypothetical protein
MYATGLSVTDIRLAYRIGVGTLYKILDAAAMPRRTLTRRSHAAINAAPLAVRVDQDATVQDVTPTEHAVGHAGTWEVHFTGLVMVQAESIDQAIAEARKLAIVRRIYTVRLKR